jgi:hypothetical protein
MVIYGVNHKSKQNFDGETHLKVATWEYNIKIYLREIDSKNVN